MKKLIATGILTFFAISLLANTHVTTLNGVNLYQAGFFPNGKMLTCSELSSLPNGKWQGKVYLATPVSFRDNGVQENNGCYTFKAKVNRTMLGRFFVRIVDSETADILLSITIPYQTPISPEFKYKFGKNSPLTVISKEEGYDSEDNPYPIYNCLYEGYMTIGRITYPKE